MTKSIVFLTYLFLLTLSKLYTNEFSLPMLRRNKGWIFLDRMSVAAGQIDINFEATLVSANVPEN